MRHISAVLVFVALSIVTACGETDVERDLRIAAMSSLDLINYLGNAENIHPKVLYFDRGWGGYRFWMAYTPYPKGDTKCENPCIAVSDDGVAWTAPDGLDNPLALPPAGGYNSDTHLVFNSADSTVECWWRAYDTKSKHDSLLRRISADGVNWSAAEVVLPASADRTWQCLSPAVSIIDGRYVMLYSDGAQIYIMRSAAPAPDVNWLAPVKVEIPFIGRLYWHQDMVVDDEGREAVVVACGYGNGGNNNSADLFGMIIDLETARSTEPVMLIKRGSANWTITSRSLYRSSLVRVGSRYKLYYSCISTDWHRHLDFLEGDWPAFIDRLRPD